MPHLRTLGGLSLAAAGTAAGVAGQRARLALLAVLAVGGQAGVSREKLLALLWPDSDADRARGALKQALYALRRHLGDAVVGNGELRLDPEVISTDVGEFELAITRGDDDAAVACYGGPFLDGVFLRSSPEFDQWVERERTRLAHAFCQTLERLASAADERGDFASAVEWWRKAASQDPLSGRIAASLVRSLARAGDAAGALRQADVYRALVRQEVGDHADPAMDAVVAAIQSGSLGTTADTEPDGGSPESSTMSREAEGARSVNGADIVAPAMQRSPVPLTRAGAPRRAVLRRLLPAVALSGLVGVVGIGAWQRRGMPIEDSVAVVAACRSTGDPSRLPMNLSEGALAELLRDRLASGLTDLRSVSVRPLGAVTARLDTNSVAASETGDVERWLQVARRARARFLVVARCRSVADSVVLSADVIDANDDRVLTTIGPVSAAPGQLSREAEWLRDRVMTAIALRVDPKLKAWVYASNAPTTFESYRELRLGIDAFVAEELAEATVHFRKAASLDTASATPLVWAGFARAFHCDPAADSILAELDASPRRMGPWDDAMVTFIRAFDRGDLPLAHRAAHALDAVVPNSEWRVLVAWSAMWENRAKEVQRVLHTVDPTAGWLDRWEFYWVTNGMAYHLLGEYREELENARRGLQHWPNNTALLQLEFKALGGLGDVDELNHRWDEVSTVRGRADIFGGPFVQGADEIRAHVGVAAARPFYDRMIATYRSQLGKGSDRSQDHEIRSSIVWALMMSGRVDAARAALDSLLPAEGLLSLDAEVSALQGNREKAHRLLAQLEPPESEAKKVGLDQDLNAFVERAILHALLDEKADAVTILEQATRAGLPNRQVLHSHVGLDRLKGYPPFDALVRPVDTPENP